jgi:melanoma-associated antigen p97
MGEDRKCVDLRNALAFASLQQQITLPPLLECLFRAGKDECMRAMENGQADVMAVEAGDMFTAGRWNGLVPIAVEEYGGASVKSSVVVVRKTAQITSLEQLQSKQLCSPGVGSMAGWIIPVNKLLRRSMDFQNAAATAAGECDL